MKFGATCPDMLPTTGKYAVQFFASPIGPTLSEIFDFVEVILSSSRKVARFCKTRLFGRAETNQRSLYIRAQPCPPLVNSFVDHACGRIDHISDAAFTLRTALRSAARSVNAVWLSDALLKASRSRTCSVRLRTLPHQTVALNVTRPNSGTDYRTGQPQLLGFPMRQRNTFLRGAMLRCSCRWKMITSHGIALNDNSTPR